MSNWIVAIVGGAIATVVGGLILFYILPAQQVPGLSSPSIAPVASVAATNARHLKCTMSGGTMGGRVYTFTIDLVERSAAWADYGVALKIVHLDEQRIHTNVKTQLYGWPKHDYVGFNFNRLSLAVEGVLAREPTSEEVAKCRAQPGGP